MHLNGTTCYLSYPMESDWISSEWVSKIKPELAAMGVNIFDPGDKPSEFGTLNREQEIINRYVEEGNWNALSVVMKKINRIDLRMVDKSDFLIARVSNKVPMAGAIHEIINADLQKKPVLIYCPDGKSCVNKWLFGFLDHTLFFDEVSKIVEYLKYINASGLPNDKWTKLT
jgi:hypothetical protein